MNKKDDYLRNQLKKEGFHIPLLFYHLKPIKKAFGKKVSKTPFSVDLLDTEKVYMRGFYKTISKSIDINNEKY